MAKLSVSLCPAAVLAASYQTLRRVLWGCKEPLSIEFLKGTQAFDNCLELGVREGDNMS